MTIQWAIPSYKRPVVCAESTVAMLIENGVNPTDITIFLSDPNEQSEYEKQLTGTGVAIKGSELGVANNRKHIQHSYPEGTQLVCCDDDLTGIQTKSEDGKRLEPLHIKLPEFAEGAFARSKESGANLWGIYAAQNAMFMSHTETAGLRYIMGGFFGTTTIDKDVARNHFLESSGEDFVTSILSFIRYGCTYRIDWVTAKTKYFSEGGIDAELKLKGTKRQDDHTRTLHRIAETYPDLATTYTKAGGITNLRLKRITAYKNTRPENTYL
jgi:hypothetical protein|tara:strand:+ start:211 stop:1017 length:807 start_codon:yes stop_codon:yes gene_type:complete